MPNIENIITAKEFSLQDILSNKKYSVDFFQREYSWKKENMVQLVYDLTNAFYENYHTGDTPESIDNEMAVLSTHIEPGMGCGKMVHELTLYRTGQMSSYISD